MVRLEIDELQTIVGGINLSGTLLSAFNKLIDSVVEVGRYIGSATRRLITRSNCLC